MARNIFLIMKEGCSLSQFIYSKTNWPVVIEYWSIAKKKQWLSLHGFIPLLNNFVKTMLRLESKRKARCVFWSDWYTDICPWSAAFTIFWPFIREWFREFIISVMKGYVHGMIWLAIHRIAIIDNRLGPLHTNEYPAKLVPIIPYWTRQRLKLLITLRFLIGKRVWKHVSKELNA